MKKFILKIFCVTLFIISILSLMETVARRVPNDYSVKNSLLELKCSSLKTIVIGNSQAYFGVNPLYFRDEAFNAAHVSEPLNMDAFILNKFLPKMVNLKYIFISISSFTPFSFWEPGGEGESWRIKHYHLYYNYPTDLFDVANQLELYNMNFPNDKRWAKVLMGKSLVYTDSLGFGHDYVKFHEPNWENCATAVKIHTVENYLTHHNVQKNKVILNTIAEQNKDKIIYLFLPPVWKTYSDLMDKGQIKFVKSFCENIEHSYRNVNFLDFYEDKRFIAEDFADAYHLSEKGAKKLTLMLDELISD